MNDIQKMNVCDILDSNGVDLRKSLAAHFRDLSLSEPTPEDYQLLDSTIAAIQEGIWVSDELDLDYAKLKSKVYEALIDGRKPKSKEPENYVGENKAEERDRAIIDFTFDWLRCLLR